MLRACESVTAWVGSFALGDEMTAKRSPGPNAALTKGGGLATFTNVLGWPVPGATPPVGKKLPGRPTLGGWLDCGVVMALAIVLATVVLEEVELAELEPPAELGGAVPITHTDEPAVKPVVAQRSCG